MTSTGITEGGTATHTRLAARKVADESLADAALLEAATIGSDDVTGEQIREIPGDSPLGDGSIGPVSRVAVTPAALALLRTLAERHGPLLLHQSGGCCDGSAPMCYPRDEFIVGDRDVLLGVVGRHLEAGTAPGGDGSLVGGGVPVYIGGLQFAYWSHTHLTVDLVRGRGSGFSLEAPEGYRFLTRSRLFSDDEADALDASGPVVRGAWQEPAADEARTGAAAATGPAWNSPASAEQLAELAALAAELGEDVPAGMRRSEAEVRLEEFRRRTARRTGPRKAVRSVELPD